MAGAKSTSKAKAAKATDAAADQTPENGASAPVSLAPGAAGTEQAGGAAGAAAGNGDQAGGSDESSSSNGAEDSGGVAEGGNPTANHGADSGDSPGDSTDVGPGSAGGAGSDGSSDASGSAGAAGGGDSGDPDGASGAVGADSSGGPGGDSTDSSLDPSPDLGPEALAQQAQQAAGEAIKDGGIGEALLALIDADKTAQTPAEESAVAPVTSAVWGLPQIKRFPAKITLKNNTPSRVVVLGIRLEPYTEQSGGVDENSYARLAKYLAGHARLGGWDHSTGVQVTHDSED